MRDAPLYRSSHSALSARWRWQNSVCFSYTQEALKANRPALEVMTELEFISPTATLSQVTAGQPGR
jgi:hypothetical protein